MNTPGAKVPKHLPDVLILGLFATWPFLRFVGHNYAQLTAQDLLGLSAYAAAYGGAAFALYLVALALRRGERFAVGIAAFTVCLFGYDLLRLIGLSRGGGWNPAVPVAVWSAATILVVGFFSAKARSPLLRTWAATTGAVLLAMAAYDVAASAWRGRSSAVSVAAQTPKAAPGARKPNVYFFLLDSYPRADFVRTTFGTDNSAFVRGLEELGFTVASDSFSNYPNTRLSLAAMLEMAYPADERRKPDTPASELYPTRGRFSEAAAQFKRLGYNLVFATDGATISFGCGADQYSVPLDKDPGMASGAYSFCIPAGRGLSQAKLALLTLTPALDLARLVDAAPVESSLVELPRIADYLPFRAAKPTFLLAHILLPHLPGRFDADCRPVSSAQHLLNEAPADVAGGKQEFLGNLLCANRQITDLVRKVLAGDPTAIIHITGDHGTYFGIWQEYLDRKIPMNGIESFREIALGRFEPSQASIREAFAILNATRLPASCRSMHHPAISPVNSIRLILTCLGSTGHPLLPDESYFGDYTGHAIRRVDPRAEK